MTSKINATISGSLPGGGIDEVTCQIAGIVPFLVMKSMALADRIKEKDAYDVEYVLRFYPGGVTAVAEAFLPLKDHGLVKEALQKLGAKFGSPDHVGPRWIVDFLGIIDREERIVRQRQAHRLVDSLLVLLNDHGGRLA